jgi:hypothetical protein
MDWETILLLLFIGILAKLLIDAGDGDGGRRGRIPVAA